VILWGDMGKTFVAFFSFCGANSWFMSGLRKRRRQKDVFFYVSGRFSVAKDREHFVMALMIRRKGK